ncbi:MAG TPA: AMP-binding protein, partial [Pirellulaceae bacterium]
MPTLSPVETPVEMDSPRPRPSIFDGGPEHASTDAIVIPRRRWLSAGYTYQRITFGQLRALVDQRAAGLQQRGIGRGDRIVLLAPFGGEFITLVFAIMRTGATLVLVDPGMGLRPALQCLSEVEPDGFVAVARAHAIRWWNQRMFPKSRWHVTVGRGGFGTPSAAFEELAPGDYQPVKLVPSDSAAIIFTSGSTGVAKGV